MDSHYKNYFPLSNSILLTMGLKTLIEFIFTINLVLRIIRPEGYKIVGTSLETCASERMGLDT